MSEPIPSRVLARLAAQGDEGAWHELDLRYRSALTAFGERLGLSAADAEEIAQDALSSLAEACGRGRFDPARVRLSSWLFMLVRDRVIDRWRKRAARGPERGDSVLGELQDERRLSALWEESWRAALLAEALRRLREESGLGERTLAAFTALALEERDAASVGAALGLDVNAVYQAKFRASKRLREIVTALMDADRIAGDGPPEARA
ncbi:MAG: sigma-70 family RNA polymerase sigma factor [Planctomycetota bacterium]